MTPITAQFGHLDETTHAYLTKVRDARGVGCPGVFVKRTQLLPGCGCILGPLVMLPALLFAGGKSAAAVAMLQTAGVLLGGWMLAYSFRRYFRTDRVRYAGHFDYFDPTHIYQANGESVTITPTAGMTRAEADFVRKPDGSSGTPVVHFTVADREFSVAVADAKAALQVQNYYAILDQLERGGGTETTADTDAARGAEAVALSKQGEGSVARLEVEEMPTRPSADGQRRGAGFPRYLTILAAGGLLFAGFWFANGFLRDGIAFEEAKLAGPPGLRLYLLDARNTGHRAEAEKLLADAYAPAIQKVTDGTKDEAARDGLTKLLERLRSAPQPEVSLNVVLVQLAANGPASSDGWPVQIRSDVADRIATHFGRNLIAFVAPPTGEASHLTIVPRFEPPTVFGGEYSVFWKLVVRPTLDGPAFESKEYKLGSKYTLNDATAFNDAFMTELFGTLFSTAPPTVTAPPATGGDW